MTARPPLLDGGEDVDASAGKQLILTRFRHLTMEDNLRFDAKLPGVGAQIRVPPAGTDDVEAGVGTHGKIIKNVLDALVRNEPRQRHQAVRVAFGFAGRGGPTVADDLTAPHAEALPCWPVSVGSISLLTYWCREVLVGFDPSEVRCVFTEYLLRRKHTLT